jgi:hypothetical protein
MDVNEYRFLALTSKDVNLNDYRILGMVYAPGLVCTSCLSPLKYAFVVKKDVLLQLVDEKCVPSDEYLYYAIRVLQQRRYFLCQEDYITDANLPHNQKLKFRRLSLLSQIYPDDTAIQDFWNNARALGPRMERKGIRSIQARIKKKMSLRQLLSFRDQVRIVSLLQDIGKIVPSDKFDLEDLRRGVENCTFTPYEIRRIGFLARKYTLGLSFFSTGVLAQWPPQNGEIRVEQQGVALEQIDLAVFDAYLAKQGLRPASRTAYLADLGLFADWLEQVSAKTLTPATLDAEDLCAYRQHLQDQGCQASTINRRLAALRAYTRWAHASGQRADDPGEQVDFVRQERGLPVWLNERRTSRPASRAGTQPEPGFHP